MRAELPRSGQPQQVFLVGDAERDECLSRLQQHFSEGRLTPEELDQRLSLALRARTNEQLARLTADLPSGPATAPVPARRRARRQFLAGVVVIAVVLGVGAGVASGRSGGVEDSYGGGTCEATGLVVDDGDCPDLSGQQEKLIENAEAAGQSAALARNSADSVPGNARAASWAAQAEAAAGRANRAVTDAQIIMATSPQQHPRHGALDAVAKTASKAAADAARAAIEADYAAQHG
jgi:hypothetical protein